MKKLQKYIMGRVYKGPGKLLGFVKCSEYRESCGGCLGRLRFQKTAEFLKDPKSECGYYDTSKVYRLVK